jgi:hypothetical protein
MDYERAKTLQTYSNNLIYGFMSYDRLPDKYKTIPIHHFFLLHLSKHIAKYQGGLFLASDLQTITHYKQKFIFNWLENLINRGFLAVSSKSVFMHTSFGSLAIRQYNRVLFRLMCSNKLPTHLDNNINTMQELTKIDIQYIKNRTKTLRRVSS